MSPGAAGIGYSMWLRLRWVAIGMVIYLLALIVAVQLVPSPMYIGIMGTLALSSVVAHVLTAFTLGPSDLGIRGSGFPKNMMVLPLTTRALVGCPMLYGATSAAALWLILSACVLRPAGLATPVVWPAALAAAGTAWLQAVSWAPFPSPFARIPALVVAATPIVLFGCCAGMYMENRLVSVAMSAGSCAWIMGAYWFGVRGLTRARSGSDGQWLHDLLDRRIAKIRARFLSRSTTRSLFRSPFTSHLWYECRRNVPVLPMMFAFAAVPMTFVVVGSTFNPRADELFIVGAAQLSPSMLGLSLMIFGLVAFCGLYGPGMGKFDVWGKDAMPAFFAIRPVTTTQFVAIKMAAAAVSVLATYAIVCIMIVLWALAEASPWNPRESIVRATFANLSPRTLALLIAAPIALYALACREMLTAMWSAFTGRKWVPIAFGILIMILLSVGGSLGYGIYRRPAYHPLFLTWLPWLVGCLMIIRFSAAGWVLAALKRQQLVPVRLIQKWIAVWAAGCVILFLLVWSFTPPTWMVAASVVLLVPFVRLAAAPLALHYNRHR